MTPRKFKSQLDVHRDVQQQLHGGTSSREQKRIQKAMNIQTGYIDQIPNW